jgi:hypothetical protein
MIKSISYDQEEIIKDIIRLHLKGESIECDPTYSKGYFYKNITPPKYKFDILPQTIDTVKRSATDLPFMENELNSIMFDPPFLATTGKSLKSNDSNNCINKRFGVFESEKLLHEFYDDSLKEFYRILDKKGILIFKCQDKVSSGKQYFSHILIHHMAEKIGFYALDLFILLAKNRIVADWQKENQKHARKYHSYFWVFIKK